MKKQFNYAITGQAGLIGKDLMQRLNAIGGTCIVKIDRREGMEIKDLENLDISTPIDYFFHLAANCKINQQILNPQIAFENSRANEIVFEFCRQNAIKNIIYFSSSRTLSKERNPYTASKEYGEELCKTYKACYDINYIIIRPSTVYGKDDETKRLMQIWIDAAKQNKDLEIYGNKNKTLDFTYIDDFNNAVLIALKKDKWNCDYDISGRCEMKLVDVAKEIIKQTKSKSKIIFKEPELQQPQRVKLKNTLTLKEYKPKYDIKRGIAKCL